MKKLLLLVAVVAMVLPGCKKIEESIDATNARIDKLEQETIPSIDEQIAAINVSLDALEKADEELGKYIQDLEAVATNLQEQINDTNTKIDAVKAELQGEISDAKTEVLAKLESVKAELEAELAQINATIETLKAKDEELDKKIDDLRSYVDTELGKTTDWVNATFATLEQLYALSGEVAALKSLVDANKAEAAANLATAISLLETSLKSWVGEQLSNYYKIAEIDAKILALETAIANGDSALQQQLNELKSQLETTKSEVTEAYKKAIEEAITKNNGVIEGKIADAVAEVNQRIDSEVETINAKIAAIEARLNNIEAQVKDLLARIQSVSYVPQYSDGKALVTRIGAVSEVILDFKVSPKECVAELEKVWSEALSCEAVYTKTRAVSLVKMPVTEFVADAENGVITITASGENLSEEFFAGTQEASVALVISDGNNSVTSEYVPMITKEVTEEIWYKTTDGQPLTPNNVGVEIFGANIVSNTYNEESGWFVLKFDGPVTTIGYAAFWERTSLTSITIPNSVTSIEKYAFAYCSSLTSVAIPDSVTSIGQGAFSECTSLTSITIPDSVTSIGNRAFEGCTSLTSVTIPNGITKIANHTFINCKALTNITLPANLEIIGTAAFQGCSSATSFTIPNTVTEIGEYTFAGCTSLTSFTIPNGVTEIKNRTFMNCKALTDITIPDSITSVGGYAFYSCTSLTSVTIPDSVTSIGDYAFYSCTSLASATIGNGVTEIGEQAFKHTTSKLSRLEIPSSVKVIGKQCFEYTEMQELILSEGLEEIGAGAFHCCLRITSLTIPNSVTKIGDQAFLNCPKLEKIYGKYSTADNYNVIVEDRLIWVSTFVTGDYEIPNNVKVVGSLAIAYPKNVITITIPESVEEFFRGEYRNSSFLLQDKVSALYGKYTTNDHRAVIKDNKLYAVATHGLSSYNVPEGVVEIEPRTLLNCGLREIILPSTLKILGQEQLKESKTLEYIYSKATTPPTIGDETFVNTVKLQKIYVPRNSVEAYKAAQYWSDYASYIEGYDF